MELTILVLMLVTSGCAALTIELVIRAQVNRHLAPEERIRAHELQNPFVWLGQDGLLARHKRLYPKSRLSNVFPVAWLIFFGTLVGWIVYQKYR